jgi:hypothetical protein
MISFSMVPPDLIGYPPKHDTTTSSASVQAPATPVVRTKLVMVTEVVMVAPV